MNRHEEIKDELKSLIEDANKLIKALSPSEKSKDASDIFYFIKNYDLWYTKALSVVKNLIPDRVNDFTLLYRNDKRKQLSVSTYTIFDALKGLEKLNNFSPVSALSNLIQQKGMLQACLGKFDSKIYDIQAVLQADLFDTELDSARYLLKNGFVRAAGAICGVVLEKHLLKVCESHSIKLSKNPTLSNLNESLKDVAYDLIEWRRISRLADLRNLCDHNKHREPEKEEIEELIAGTDRVIKTIF